ncbi:UNVERIFIED_CONTAM: E3 ubiquitin-protein ligase SIS3 [Sesamum radiatum]|uniref:E3 ubiquitin-protein ligase SIS3 n=1 Tax=Sesamum radiatum TaxID=300843 RepID=A0AAW2S007_SESRA
MAIKGVDFKWYSVLSFFVGQAPFKFDPRKMRRNQNLLCELGKKGALVHDLRDLGWQQRYPRFCGRIVVLSILATVIGTLWFTSGRDCAGEFTYGFVFFGCVFIFPNMRFSEGWSEVCHHKSRVNKLGLLVKVFVDLVRVPDWAFEAAGHETRGMDVDAAQYQLGLSLTPAQVTSGCLQISVWFNRTNG